MTMSNFLWIDWIEMNIWKTLEISTKIKSASLRIKAIGVRALIPLTFLYVSITRMLLHNEEEWKWLTRASPESGKKSRILFLLFFFYVLVFYFFWFFFLISLNRDDYVKLRERERECQSWKLWKMVNDRNWMKSEWWIWIYSVDLMNWFNRVRWVKWNVVGS